MDFFEAQDEAQRKTKRLVFYYLVAVVLIAVAVYGAVTLGIVVFHGLARSEGMAQGPPVEVPLWDLSRFLGAAGGVILVVGLGSLYKVLSLRGGGEAVAKSLGGERVDRSTGDGRRRQLLNVVEEMAIASGVPVPEVYILTGEDSINAFAAGWGRDDAVIAVSAGALRELSRDELQGVVAHEYSHILHGDCRLNIRLMGILFGIMMLGVFGQIMRVTMGLGGRRRGAVIVAGGSRRGGGGKGNGGALIIAVILVIVLVTIIGYVGMFFARLIQAAISRQREYLADAAAVQFSRNPEGISGALKKIGGHADKGVLEHGNAAEAAHMFFADGLRQSFSSAFSTHPPLEERIQRLDPAWDGSTPPPEEAAPAAPAAVSPGPASATGTGEAGPAGRSMIEGMAILGAVGTMSAGNLHTAKGILSAIPEALDTRMRETDGARNAVAALLVADNEADDAGQMALLGEALGTGAAEEIRSFTASIRNLPRGARLGILELATTTLAHEAEFERKPFFSLMTRLVQADERMSFYEFCIRRITRERLQRKTGAGGSDTGIRHLKVGPAVAKAAGTVLSVIAREAAGRERAGSVMKKALKGQGLLREKVGYIDGEESSPKALDEALDLLRESAYAIRAEVLRTAVFCIREDGQLSPAEAEALRALSLSLDCPLPPLET